jgi:hypothetical protein
MFDYSTYLELCQVSTLLFVVSVSACVHLASGSKNFDHDSDIKVKNAAFMQKILNSHSHSTIIVTIIRNNQKRKRNFKDFSKNNFFPKSKRD